MLLIIIFILLLACSKIQLQELVDGLVRVSRKYRLSINAEKTKMITTGGSSCNIAINNMLVEVVSSFPYLGSLSQVTLSVLRTFEEDWQKVLTLEQSSRRFGRITAYVFLQRSVS